MRRWLLLIDFVVATIAAILANIVASYLQQTYQLITDPIRVTLVIVAFLISILVGGYFVLTKTGESPSATTYRDRSRALDIGDGAQVGSITVREVAGRDIADAVPNGEEQPSGQGADSAGIIVGKHAKTGKVDVDQLAGRDIVR